MAATAYQVTVHHRGQTYRFTAPADQPVLQAAFDQGVELPSSCQAGVCTTCAARLRSGSVTQPDAMGIGPELKEQGFVLLCVAYATSDLVVETDQEDEVYRLQFGS
ncbi:2Fe-2S iron-sulfur cluster-binding protein [Thermostichus vulcanus]|uniref:2Fe-2S iron-sulfur cluster binding domain-containing protein n=1 Tax=Thermostichus vulcanus str. 'Rupite' TaxID=2813851 RepID=A0ABT0CB44_THEVL|nr:2Fe-2S iron-sulfur cluster-binding protein [Thermostichus vulcanus]MCJ2543008.1 2Fe-2S iron-sulfur cluster binding domain-containing protein [Thermostichus vulcanus str. 'Rupite']